jgi:hypothetical protein
MIRDNALLGANGASLVTPHAGAQLLSPIGIARDGGSVPVELFHPRPKQPSGALLVLALTSATIASDDQPSGPVGNDDTCLDLVAMLPAGARPPGVGNSQIRLGDLQVLRLRLRQDRDRDGAGVNSAPLLVGGNALPAVAARFTSK